MTPRPSGLDRRTLWTLIAGNTLTMIGVGFILPMVPLLITVRGGSPTFVGVVFAAGVLVRAVAQYPAGWLADRVGRRPVIVSAMLAYGLAFPLYALRMPLSGLLLLRCVQAVAGGAYFPAAAALISDLADEDHRSAAYAKLRASDMFGLLIGPAIGGFVARLGLATVFVSAGAVCLVATIVALGLPRTSRHPAVPPAGEVTAGPGPWRIMRLLIPIAALGVPGYWWSGTFDTVWSLQLSGRGASPTLVGVSFAVFALPPVLLSGMAGRIADRVGYATAATVAVAAYGAAAVAYGLVRPLAVLVVLLLAEGTLTAAGGPSLSAAVSRLAPPGAQARTQGLYQAILLGAQVGGSLAGGKLFAVRHSYPFFATGLICASGIALSAATRPWRDSPDLLGTAQPEYVRSGGSDARSVLDAWSGPPDVG